MPQSYQDCRDHLASRCDCEENAQCKYNPDYYLRRRYYCRGADGPNGHCDDRPMTIQCDHCIWTEDQARRGNYEDRIKNNE